VPELMDRIMTEAEATIKNSAAMLY
jgi:hypothetical protein